MISCIDFNSIFEEKAQFVMWIIVEFENTRKNIPGPVVKYLIDLMELRKKLSDNIIDFFISRIPDVQQCNKGMLEKCIAEMGSKSSRLY